MADHGTSQITWRRKADLLRRQRDESRAENAMLRRSIEALRSELGACRTMLAAHISAGTAATEAPRELVDAIGDLPGDGGLVTVSLPHGIVAVLGPEDAGADPVAVWNRYLAFADRAA